MGVRYIGDNAPDGMCVGVASTEKLSFYGTTPVTQRANASQAAATDAASVIVLANELRSALVALGLIKGSA